MIKNKVSVIMPCYNHEDFVEQAIESVLNQSYNKFNFYIADDSSTDKSVEKILQYENQVDEIHLFDKNMGGLVRFLITRVDTEYVALLNSDDFWEKDKLEKQIEYMETHADCAADKN